MTTKSLTIGYHASHEQFAPDALLDHVIHAEAAGFQAAMCSEHFHPWSRAQGQSGHAWCWLGAAMARTTLPFGLVTAPVGRQHPATVAQAAATLMQMHGAARFWLAPGSGEALNEGITGAPWPSKPVRNERLHDAVQIMRALWRGEEVSRTGLVPIDQARLYTLPDCAPPLYAPALSAATAAWAGAWADGLLTLSQPTEKLRALIAAFRENGGEHKPLLLQVKLAVASDDADALAGAYAQWRTNVFASEVSANLRTPQQFEAAAVHVRPEDVARAVHVSADPARHAAWLNDYRELGFDGLYLHNVHPAQTHFIEVFGERVLPQLR